jgi:hypothetical protein
MVSCVTKRRLQLIDLGATTYKQAAPGQRIHLIGIRQGSAIALAARTF